MRRPPGARHDRRRRDRRGPEHGRCRRYRLLVPVARGQGGRRRRDDPAQGRGGRHPLGRQPRGAGRQPQLRRRPGPGQSRSRLVLEGRGPSGGLRREEGSGGRGRGRERGRGVYDAVAVRELAGGAAPRDRRGRSDPLRQGSRLLGPGPALRRPRRAGRRHLLHLPEGPDERSAELQPAGLHRLCDRRLPPSRGHLVRGAAGRCGRGRPVRRRLVAHEQPGHEDPRAARGRRRCRERLCRLSGRTRQAQRLGRPRRDQGGQLPELGQSSAAFRPPRAERQPQAGAQAVGQAAGASTRRSTTGTTPSTTTA